MRIEYNSICTAKIGSRKESFAYSEALNGAVYDQRKAGAKWHSLVSPARLEVEDEVP